MAKIKEVAYVPISTTASDIIQAPTKIETPNYPDKGVEYAYYSKSLISNNQYRLNNQESITFTGSGTFSGAAGGVTFTWGKLADKDFYITNLQYSGNCATAGTISMVSIQVASTIVVAWGENLGGINTFTNLQFKTPIKIPKGNSPSYTLSFATSRQLNDKFVLSLCGWIE